MANKKLLNKITESITTETKKFLRCGRCGRTLNVSHMTPEGIAKEGWTLHKYGYEEMLICGRCTNYYQENSIGKYYV